MVTAYGDLWTEPYAFIDFETGDLNDVPTALQILKAGYSLDDARLAMSPFLRTFSDFNAYIGTEEYYEGTTLDSANDAEHVWSCPAFAKGDVERSYGKGPSIALLQRQCSPTAVDTTNGPDVEAFDHGMRLVEPESPYTFRSFQGLGVMPSGGSPNRWGVRIKVQLPPDPNLSTSIGTHAILSQAQYDFGLWQVYYDSSSNRIMFSVAGDTSSPYEMLDAPERETTISIFVGRDGDDDFWYSADGATPTHVTPGFVLGNSEILIVGGGQTPSTFPTNDTQDGLPNLLIVDDVIVWHRALDPDPDSEIVSVQSGTWPWGRS